MNKTVFTGYNLGISKAILVVKTVEARYKYRGSYVRKALTAVRKLLKQNKLEQKDLVEL